MSELRDLRVLAADMIERLLEDPEHGICQTCREYTCCGQPHKVDCEAQLLIQGLRAQVLR